MISETRSDLIIITVVFTLGACQALVPGHRNKMVLSSDSTPSKLFSARVQDRVLEKRYVHISTTTTTTALFIPYLD